MNAYNLILFMVQLILRGEKEVGLFFAFSFLLIFFIETIYVFPFVPFRQYVTSQSRSYVNGQIYLQGASARKMEF